MTTEQCIQALLLGISLADRAAADGVKVLGTGDMGISNTTPSTALYCAYLDLAPEGGDRSGHGGWMPRAWPPRRRSWAVAWP